MVTIYLIKNSINNKKYVGQTNNSIEARFSRHCWLCSKDNQLITKAINKYGKENFHIEKIDEAETLEEANRKEVYWANYFNCFSPNGYNLKAGGRKYLHISQEVKEKMRRAQLGKKASEETRKKLSILHTGCKVSEKTKAKLSSHNRGKAPHINANIAASKSNSKKYILKTPNGEPITVINMREFCIQNKLQPTNMSNVITGKIKTYKGWSLLQDCGFIRGKSRRNKT